MAVRSARGLPAGRRRALRPAGARPRTRASSVGDVRGSARINLSRPRATWVAAGVATVLALFSALASAETTWRALNADHRLYSAFSTEQRLYAPSWGAGFQGSLFVFFASFLRDGDRVYYQVPRDPYGTLDLHDTVAALGRFYLLPAVEVTDLNDATVVISYHADPSSLGRAFLAQRQNGPDIYISRLANP
jgi:hypothetical protein